MIGLATTDLDLPCAHWLERQRADEPIQPAPSGSLIGVEVVVRPPDGGGELPSDRHATHTGACRPK
jgi:hypothetical protein